MSNRHYNSVLPTGFYGPRNTYGIVTDHLWKALDAEGIVRVTASGRTYVTGPQGGEATPVLCGEVVAIFTEDGTIDGRCGAPVLHNDFACPSHAAEIRRWRNESASEQFAAERQAELLDRWV